jgi:hypothetical protein
MDSDQTKNTYAKMKLKLYVSFMDTEGNRVTMLQPNLK